MCPARAGESSPPQELMPALRCSVPPSFGNRFPIGLLLLPPAGRGTSLVLSQKSLAESQGPSVAGGFCMAAWWMLHSTPCAPLRNPLALQRLLIKGS